MHGTRDEVRPLMAWLRVIHRWVGIVLCAIAAVVALTGGLLLVRGPYERARYPALARPMTAYASVDQRIARQADILAAIEARFAHDRAGLRTIKFPRPGASAWRLYLGDDEEAFVVRNADGPVIGSDDLTVVGRWSWRDNLSAFVFELHAHLLAHNTGSTINGIAALLILFLALTGLILWWPRRAGAFRLRRAVPRGASAGELLRSHAATGAIASVPILIFAATGAAIIFYTTVAPLLSAALDARPPAQISARVARDPNVTTLAPPYIWASRLRRVQDTFPDGELVMINPGRGANAVLTFRLRLPGEWHPNGRSYVLMSPYDGSIVQTIDARRQGAGTRLAHALYPMHAAMFDSVVARVIALVLAMIASCGLTWLSVGGLAAYLQKLRVTSRVVANAQAAALQSRRDA
jgi:uncharacterized iron-regulated membrane protein